MDNHPTHRQLPLDRDPSGTRGVLFAGIATLGLFALGCAGSQAFDTRFPDNRATDLERVLERINAAPARNEASIAVGLTEEPRRLFGFDLQTRRVSWQTPVAASSAPILAGDSVLVQTGRSVTGFDLRTGRAQLTLDTGDMDLRGADGAGTTVALIVATGMGIYARSELIVVADGSVRYRREISGLGGSPAVVGSLVLVPWSSQYLSALDAHSGVELARLRVKDGVITHALAAGRDVFIGSQQGLSRITAELVHGKLRGASFFEMKDSPLPGRPMLLDDLYVREKSVPPDGAQHRIGLAFRPALRGDGASVMHDRLYLAFYRLLFALDPKTHAVAWVYVHPSDMVSAAVTGSNVVVADEQGRFAFLDARSGTLNARHDTGLKTAVVRFPGADEPGAADPASRPPDAAVLRDQLFAVAQHSDARLVPARLFAVEQLATVQDAEATAALVSLCDDERVTPPVRNEACTLLRDRALGADHITSALERHASYLAGTTPPAVGALAKAAASQKVKSAVPLLIAHLGDPSTPSRDLASLVGALRELSDPAATEPLTDFLLLYHADPIDEHLVAALSLVPDALLQLSGPVARPTLERVADDPLSARAVRERAVGALAAIDALERAAQARDAEAEAEQTEEASSKDAESEPSMPQHLTTDLISKALLPVRDQLQACLLGSTRRVRQARIVLVVEEGKALMASVLPAELQGCVEPLVRAQSFPLTRIATRERITYLLKRN